MNKLSPWKVYDLSDRVDQNEMRPPSQGDVKEACLSLFYTLVKNRFCFLFLFVCL